MGSITLTNISHFIEQPGRIVTKNIGALDRMTVRYLGPWNAVVPFKEGAPDTQYPRMFITGWNENYNGALKQLDVNYVGRTDSDWPNDILITISGSEKELNFAEMGTSAGQIIRIYPPNSPPIVFESITYCLDQYNLHYVGEIITYKYVSYGDSPEQKIADNAQVLSQYISHVSRGSFYSTISGVDVSQEFPGPYGYSGPYQRLTAFTFQNVIDKWYECSSSTEARYEVP